MKAISINGHDLTKIRLKLNPLQDGVFSYITYPVDKFSSEIREGLFYLSDLNRSFCLSINSLDESVKAVCEVNNSINSLSCLLNFLSLPFSSCALIS